MAEVRGQGVHFFYETAGDGFPLVLAPGSQGGWSPYIPLLSELCRTIMYTGHDLVQVPPAKALHPSARAAAMCRRTNSFADWSSSIAENSSRSTRRSKRCG